VHARSLRLDAAVILVGSDSIRSQTNHTFQTDSPFMTTPENQDPWGSLADSLGVPAGSAPEPPVEKKAPEPAPAPVNPAPKAEAPRREPRPAPTADWTALANEFGLEPAAEPAAPAAEPAAAEATPTSQDAPREDRRRSDNRRDNERRGRSPQCRSPQTGRSRRPRQEAGLRFSPLGRRADTCSSCSSCSSSGRRTPRGRASRRRIRSRGNTRTRGRS
jgi:hypothetical protein